MSLNSHTLGVANKVVMSGIQPTGVFHLGNILGAVNAWRQLAAPEAQARQVIYMVADLHSLTVSRAPSDLQRLRWDALASLVACGLDPKRCNLYFQSQVPAHARMHWLLSCVASMGYLGRMTQWKAGAQAGAGAGGAPIAAADANLGRFSYPVLQAADVLVNGAEIVPVGEDQAQHLELTRHVANSFNFRYGANLSAPQTVLTPFRRVLSLRDPQRKMSKSDPDQSSCLYITDTPAEVQAKLRRAVTDSVPGPITYDPKNRPAVSNLVMLAAGLQNIEPYTFLANVRPQNHGELKAAVLDAVVAATQEIRAEYARLVADRAYLEAVAREGAEVANERCEGVYEESARLVGL